MSIVMLPERILDSRLFQHSSGSITGIEDWALIISSRYSDLFVFFIPGIIGLTSLCGIFLYML